MINHCRTRKSVIWLDSLKINKKTKTNLVQVPKIGVWAKTSILSHLDHWYILEDLPFLNCYKNKFLLFQLCKHLSNILLVSQSDHDVQLFKFNINWIIILHKEHFHLILEDVRSAKNNGKVTSILTLKLMLKNLLYVSSVLVLFHNNKYYIINTSCWREGK